MRNVHRLIWLTCLVVLALGPAVSAQTRQQGASQPNGQAVWVGRLSHTEGQVLRYVYEEKDWIATVKDTPFGAEDTLYSDQDGKIEIQVPNGTLIRAGGNTQVQGIALEEDLTEVDIASGMSRIYNRGGKTIIKATTPFGYVVAPADSQLDLYVGDDSLEVIALKGSVDFIHARNEARYDVVAGGSSLIANSREVTSGDGNVDAAWDDWNLSRDNLLAKRLNVKGDSHEYLPPQLHGDAYDLETNGRWERVHYEGEYRTLWRPTRVARDWTPFSVGRWSVYYGDNCWIPYEPFGYVTHHYGNWVFIDSCSCWYWAPPVAYVAVPARPAWGIGFGWYPGRVSWLYSDASVGWVPLAPYEPYYSHRYWGPASYAVASVSLPGININIGNLRWHRHGVFVGHRDFYRVNSYRNVRITNINNTTIINNYRAAPVINNRVIRDFDTSRDRFHMTDVRVRNKPHRSVVERVDRNRELAERFRAERIQGERVLRDAREIRQGQVARDVRIERPRLTSRVVPVDQVDRPRSELRLPQRDLIRQERAPRGADQRLQRLDERQPRLRETPDRQREQRDLREGRMPGQEERPIRPERPQRERLDQIRREREQQPQREDTRRQIQEPRTRPEERRQRQLEQRPQPTEDRRRGSEPGSQDLRQEGPGALERQQRLEQQRGRQMEERRQEQRQQQQQEQRRQQQLQEQRQQQQMRQQQLQEQRQQQQQMRQQQEQRRQQQLQEQRQQQQMRQQQLQEQRQQQMRQPQEQRRQQQLQEQRQQPPGQRKPRTPEDPQYPHGGRVE